MCSSSEQHGSHPPSQHPVERVLLGGEPKYRKADVADLAGVDVSRAEKLWQAMGFAHVDDEALVFTDSDVAALRQLVQLVSAEIITPEVEASVARSLAQSLSRLAEWQVGIFKSVLGTSFTEDAETTAKFTEAILPLMGQLQEYVWRRHLTATVTRELEDTGTDLPADERTLVVGFADIVGYTRLVRDFSEIELAGLIEDFENLTTGVIAENRGRVVKTVGDEVLFVADTAADAGRIALALNEGVAREERMPPLRIGLAQGQVLARFGDVYGSTVNLASRLTAAARPASVLIDRECATALRGDPAFFLTSIGPTKVQGFGGLRAWALRRPE